ncbi:MAG: hypothetical protein ABIR38_08495 [Chthoniobacterales bacterium]
MVARDRFEVFLHHVFGAVADAVEKPDLAARSLRNADAAADEDNAPAGSR